jgi:hypothetical protein
MLGAGISVDRDYGDLWSVRLVSMTTVPDPWVERFGTEGARYRRRFRRAEISMLIWIAVLALVCLLGPHGGTADQRGDTYAILLGPLAVVFPFMALLSGRYRKQMMRASLEHLGIGKGAAFPIRATTSTQAFDAWMSVYRRTHPSR